MGDVIDLQEYRRKRDQDAKRRRRGDAPQGKSRGADKAPSPAGKRDSGPAKPDKTPKK